jgi:hypothetical protein
MRFSHRKWGTIACLFAAGCGNHDGPAAGGQSGTDADGGVHCSFKFEQPSGDPVALDEPVQTGPSPNEHYARVEGSHVFTCADDTKYSVSITRGDAARRALGLLSDAMADERCEALQLDAEIHVETEDGGWSYDAAFLTANLGIRYQIGGLATDMEGRELELILMAGSTPEADVTIERMRIDRPAISTTYCEAGEDGAGGTGSSGGEGGWSGEGG